jgi:hypothetical protein
LLIDEVNELLWKSHRDLLGHPIMVAKRYQDLGVPHGRGLQNALQPLPRELVLSPQGAWGSFREGRQDGLKRVRRTGGA